MTGESMRAFGWPSSSIRQIAKAWLDHSRRLVFGTKARTVFVTFSPLFPFQGERVHAHKGDCEETPDAVRSR